MLSLARVLKAELGVIDRRNNPIPPMEARSEGSKVCTRVTEHFPLTSEFRLVIRAPSFLRLLGDYLHVKQVVNIQLEPDLSAWI